MSWRKAAVLIGALFGAVSLGGCLQPMYGQFAAGGPGLQEELQRIAIDPIPDRFGHYLGNDLIFALNGTGSHPMPKYRLIVTYTISSQTPLIDTVTGRATGADVIVNAAYQLLRIDTGAVLIKGTAYVFKSYDRTSDRYSNIRAARDAEVRDAQAMADQLRTRIAAYFAGKRQS